MIRQLLVSLLCMYLVVLMAGPVPAASLEEDLFLEMEADLSERETRQHTPQTLDGQLVDNLDLDLVVRGFRFFSPVNPNPLAEDAGYDFGGDDIEGQAQVRLQYADHVDIGKVRVGTSGWLQYGTEKDGYKGVTSFVQDSGLESNVWEINELYVEAGWDRGTFTMGRKLFDSGSVVDIGLYSTFKPYDLQDPLNPVELGVWQVRADIPVGDGRISAALLPAFIPSKPPGFETGVPGGWTGAAPDFMVAIDRDIPEISLENVGLFGQYKGCAAGVDFHLTGARTISQYPAVGLTTRTVAGTTFQDIHQVFLMDTFVEAGLSTTLGEFEVHAQASHHDLDQENDPSFWSVIYGATWFSDILTRCLGVESFAVTLNHVRTTLHGKLNSEDDIFSAHYFRLDHNDLVAGMNIRVDQDLEFSYAGFFMLEDYGGQMHRLSASYTLTPRLKGVATVELFEGDPWSFFGPWRNHDRAMLELVWDIF